MQHKITLDGKSLSIEDVWQVATNNAQVFIHPEQLQQIARIRQSVDLLANSDRAYYGINTGFGALAETKIKEKDLEKLQLNLIISHAVGVGDPLSVAESRALMLLRANTLSKGHSGCSTQVIEHLVQLLNAGCAPFVPCKGSVGASGDLAPLAHLALLLIGKGKAYINQKQVSALSALKHAHLKPLILKAKEGLALINGTQAMAALGCLHVFHAHRLCELADIIGSLTVDAMKGSDTPFDPRIHELRPHPGQIHSAHHLRLMLADSEIRKNHANCSRVQDAYSLRCMPQVHGATRDTITFVKETIEREINSGTDNPLVFEKESGEIEILSGGNFHGQPLAFALDYLAIATAELANISERRIEQLLNTALSNELPAFLAPKPGLNSGFMMLQVTAAALVNENKVFCHPASTDSISTSASREDHVSMGMTSANKAKTVLENCYQVLSIELMAAAQGISLRKPLTPGSGGKLVMSLVRKVVPFASQDRAFGQDLTKIYQLCKSGELNNILSILSEKSLSPLSSHMETELPLPYPQEQYV